MKIRALQLNPTVGDIENNCHKIYAYAQQAAKEAVDVIITPECYICGYPPEDLIFRPIFQKKITQYVEELCDRLKNLEIAIIIGAPRFENGHIYNAAFWFYKGHIKHICDKKCLPDFGTFDDTRIFSHGHINHIITHKNTKLGVMICEDMWHTDVASSLKQKKADILVSLNASPFEVDKFKKRMHVVSERIKETNLPFITSFMVGGQDELVFDGRSFAMDANQNIVAQAKGFCEDYYDISFQENILKSNMCVTADLSQDAQIYQAAILGLRDYICKNNFKGIVLGLSGGVDSVLSAVMAVDAIGADKVHCLLLPSQYTSQESFDHAYQVIDALGISYDIVSIKESVDSVQNALNPVFAGLSEDITEENLQSRMRGLILMAYSNKMGHMVLTTGNKSEMAVGYATLYGDMCGGYNCLKDIYKTQLYQLCHYRNQHIPEIAFMQACNLIPQTVITKAPTAELRQDQKDSDSLPDYDILDKILYAMIEQEKSIHDIVQQGFDIDIVKRIRILVDRAEYKRRQSAVGTKVTIKNFGRDRRYPITQNFNNF